MSEEAILAALRAVKETLEKTQQDLQESRIAHASVANDLDWVKREAEAHGKGLAEIRDRLTKIETANNTKSGALTFAISIAGVLIAVAAIVVPMLRGGG